MRLNTQTALVALMLIGLLGPSRLWSDQGQPSPAAKEMPSRAQLKARFEKVDAERMATKEETKERADVARNAMQIASDIAWLAFDAGKFDEAANWFAKRVELKQESYLNARAFWEKYLRTAALEQDGAVDEQIKGLEAQLATAEESKKETLRTSIRRWEKNRYLTRCNTLATLEQIARENDDTENLLKYAEQAFEIRRQEMSSLKKINASNEEVNQKIVQVATALEQVSNAQVDLALFEHAEKSALEALNLRRALPESTSERKVEESLFELASMYAFAAGDLTKARDYCQQVSAAIEASAAVRQKALKETRAQVRDVNLALDRMAQATALLNLGDISHKEGNSKKATSYYEMARQVGEDLPKGGYMNLFELFRGRIRARVLAGLTPLPAASGEVSPARK